MAFQRPLYDRPMRFHPSGPAEIPVEPGVEAKHGRSTVPWMFGELTSDEIDTLLREEVVARIAYVDRRDLPCIVPVNYAYDGEALYGYSLMGAKLENMGADASVCIEVDRIHNVADWRSAIVRGTFEALRGTAALDAVARISKRLKTVADATNAPAIAAQTYVRRKGGEGTAYRIRVTEKSGRYSTSKTSE